MYPKTVNQIFSRFGIEQGKIPSMYVWEKYEKKEFEWIEKRTENEVKDCIKIYQTICNRICAQKKKKDDGRR
jgi:hypothetical protein